LGIDVSTKTHFNFPNEGELELARDIARDTLRECADDNPGIWLSQLDTSEECMQAVAHYVDRHRNYMSDGDAPSYGGAQTFWYTAT